MLSGVTYSINSFKNDPTCTGSNLKQLEVGGSMSKSEGSNINGKEDLPHKPWMHAWVTHTYTTYCTVYTERVVVTC